MNYKKTLTSFTLAIMCMAKFAYPISFEIPKELESQVEAQRAAEAARLDPGLNASAGGIGPIAEGEVANDIIEAPEAEPVVDPSELNNDQDAVFDLTSGHIAGKVYDKETGAPLRGVALILEGTDIGTLTDGQGSYRLEAAPVGEYKITFFKAGYIEASITNAKVTEGELLKLDFALPPRPAEMSDEVYELQDFTVTADEVFSQNVALLALRQQSVASVDALSSEDMSKFAASDAADALKSVTGVSISGGKYAVVRGLDDRFSTTSLNGIVMPSPDPDRQAVPLDIFPAGLLDSVVTQKSYTPDQPGESSGGAINLQTKAFPEEFMLKVSGSVGYNSNATGESDFYLAEESDFGASPMRFAPKRKAPGPEYGISAYVGGSTNFFGKDVGVISGVTHKKKYSYSERLKNRYDQDGTDALVSSSSIRNVSEVEEVTSAIFGAGIKISDVTQLNYTALYSLSNIATAGIETIELESKDAEFYQIDAETLEREYLNNQLVLEHTFDDFLFGLEEVKMTMSGSYSTNTQVEPDTRVSNTLEASASPGTFSSADKSDPFRYSREMDQENLILKGDMEVPVSWSKVHELRFKSGLSYEDSVRNTEQSEWKGAGFDSNSIDELGTQNPDIVIIPDVFEIPGSPHFGSTASIIPTGKSMGTREIKSAYLMSELMPIESWEISFGARLEDTFLETVAVEPGKITQFEFNPTVTSSPIEEVSILPALTSSYEIREGLKVRFGLAETIAKPSFRELNPSPIYNTTEGIVEIGNPGLVTGGGFDGGALLPSQYQGLQLVEVQNIDMRVEWFFNDQDMVAVSLFRKQLTGPIERVEVAAGGASAFTYFNNENDAQVDGLEFETRIGLGFIGDWADDFYVGGNFTYIDASVDRSELEQGILPAVASEDRPLYNQPESILNAYIGYSSEDLGLDVTLSANRVGDQLFAVTGAGDIYVDPFTSLNLVISKKVFDNFSIKFAVKNLLDPEKSRSLRSFGDINSSDVGDNSGVANSGTDFGLRDSYQSGRSYSISASWEF